MNNWKSNYKYRPYQSFIINEKIVPEPQSFQAKNGRMYTRLVFHIPSFPEFSVLDFDYNTATHMIKIVENQFTEMLLNEINGYLMTHADDPDPWFKKVTQIAPNGQSEKEKKFDKLFDDTPSAPVQQPQQQGTQQPKQEEESEDNLWN